MPRCFLPCLCLDLHVYVLLAMFMLRSTCLHAFCHVYAQIYMFMCFLPCLYLDLHVGCYAQCLLQPFLSLVMLFSCVLPLRQGIDLDLVVQAYFHTPKPTSKDLDHFLYACVCLLASMLYIHVFWLDLGHCHVLCPTWTCACWSLLMIVMK